MGIIKRIASEDYVLNEIDEFSVRSVQYITPEMYGAVGDGKTDDSSAIQQAIDAAGGTGIVYLGKKKYKIDTGLTINDHYAEFQCDGELIYSGTGAAITLSSLYRANIKVNIIRATNGTALKMDSTAGEVTMCNIDIKYIRSSVIGVHMVTGGGQAGHNIFYNKLHIEGEITSTQSCVCIEAVTALINENFFWLGRLHGDSASADYGIKMVGADTFGGADVNGNVGRNVFFCGDMEGIKTTGCGIYLENANGNVFRNFRFEEAYGQYSVSFNGECFANDIEMSSVTLSEVDITGMTANSYDKFYNVIRSMKINDPNFAGMSEVLISQAEGFVSETRKIIIDTIGSQSTETWVFTLEDGSVVEKQVVIV